MKSLIHHINYNFARVQKALKGTPAMAVGLTTRPWTTEDIVRLIDLREGRR